MRTTNGPSPATGLRLVFALIALAGANFAHAQAPDDDSTVEISVPEIKSTPKINEIVIEDAPGASSPPPATPFGSFTPPGNSGAFPFVPFMLGDFTGPLANPMTDLKASEGESPIPLDRVFYRFNYYNSLEPGRYSYVSNPYKQVNLFTNVFGFEKTFGSSFSLGVRIPINGVQALARDPYYVKLPIPGNPVVPKPGVPNYNSTQFGNINTLFKFKFAENLAAGYLASGGVALSFPTATNARIDPGPSTATVFQPFIGGVWVRDRFFVQGFSSLTLPLVSVQSMLMFSDFGVGVWAYRNENAASFLTGFAPTVETHLNVPLQGPNRVTDALNQAAMLPFNTQFNMTFGGTFEFFSRATMGLGFVVPLVSPLPFSYEFLAHFNVRF